MTPTSRLELRCTTRMAAPPTARTMVSTLALALAWPVLIASAAAHAQTSSPTAGVPAAMVPSGDAVERGRLLYMANACFSCHGTLGQGGDRSGAPRIAPDPHPLEAFKTMLRKPRDAMPPYEARMVNDEQVALMHRYLQSIPKGQAAKDIAALQAAPAR